MTKFATWKTANPTQTPKQLSAWLQDHGSLTRRVIEHCQHDFSVELLSCQWQRPLIDEVKLLKQRHASLAYTREVFLKDGTTPLVYARTVIPRNTYMAFRYQFDGMGNRSLGEMLFTDPRVKRGKIEVCKLGHEHALYDLACRNIDTKPEALWARRSCFYIGQKSLLVNEIFLPSQIWSD